MRKEIKRIIVREGLIMLSCVAVGLILIQIGRYFAFNLNPAGDTIALLGFWVILAYPAYLTVRFMIWAIKTLRGQFK